MIRFDIIFFNKMYEFLSLFERNDSTIELSSRVVATVYRTQFIQKKCSIHPIPDSGNPAFRNWIVLEGMIATM